MLYDFYEDDEELGLEKINKNSLRKKAIICGIIILCCVIVMTISIIISVKNKNKEDTNKAEASVQENSEETKKAKVASKNSKEIKNEEGAYVGKHVQIATHDIEKIKTKFVPKQNPNAQEEITNIYYSEEKVAYLTFDDGPSKNITPQVLDILKQENVPATFFLLGARVELNPDLVKREYEEGHYLANHGYSHIYSQIYQSPDTVFDEYVKCENAIRNALGNQNYNTFLFRFPGGSAGGKYADIKAEAKNLLHSYGVNHTNWNCLTGDAEGKTTHEELMSTLQQTMEGDGSLIVLMHDASDKSYTAEALPNVISYLREQGYTFKNFYEIFK